MTDYLQQLGSIAVDATRAKGARVFVKLNAWPGEIELADADQLQGGDSGPGIVKGQVIVRDRSGRVITTIGPDVRQNWPLTAAVVGGLALVLFVIVRGIAPGRR